MTAHSKHWNTMVNILDGAFPKGECEERGSALVMLSYIEMMLLGTQFDSNGEPLQSSPRLSKAAMATKIGSGQVPDWKLQLATLLQRNRSSQDNGRGMAYWLSQVEVVEKFAHRNPEALDKE